jgi:hypothetical protein
MNEKELEDEKVMLKDSGIMAAHGNIEVEIFIKISIEV